MAVTFPTVAGISGGLSANILEIKVILYYVYVNVKVCVVMVNTLNIDPQGHSLEITAPPPESGAQSYSIGELARQFQITTRTIRFYEDKGLLSPAREGLKRIYDQRDWVRLRLVLRGKRLGFSLEEIAGIIDMYDTGPGESGQLRYMLKRLTDQRRILLQQKQDLDLTLSELDQIETQCRQQLEEMRD